MTAAVLEAADDDSYILTLAIGPDGVHVHDLRTLGAYLEANLPGLDA